MLQESGSKALGHKNHQQMEQSFLEAVRGDAWAGEGGLGKQEDQGKDKFLNTSK